MSTTTLLQQLERWLPAWWGGSRAVLAAVAGPMARAVTVAEDLATASTVGGAEGKWLTLLAKGYGVTRTDGEADTGLRKRLRNVESRLTRAPILDAVDALLEPYTAEHAAMVEWFFPGGAFYLDSSFIDNERLLGEHNTLYLFVPLIGEATWGDLYLDGAHLDDDYVGSGPSHPVYVAITAELDRIRSAGVRAVLIVGAHTPDV